MHRVLSALVLVLVTAALTARSASAQPNLIVNGSFEQPIVPVGGFLSFSAASPTPPSGWSVVGPGSLAIVSGSYTQFGYSFPAQDGVQWLDLTGISSNQRIGVQQAVATVPGATYDLSFWVGNVVKFASATTLTSTVLVHINGILRLTATNSAGGMILDWQRFTLSFTATGPTTILGFFNGDPTNDENNGLDNIVLTFREGPLPVQISGRVQDPQGNPLPGVTMSLTGTSSATTTTAADGTYGFADLSSGGDYTVTPSAAGRGFVPALRSFTNVTTKQTADFVGHLVHQISGQVRDLNDTGVPGVTITLSGSQSGTVLTDLEGRYVFTGLFRGGSYTVTPSRPTFVFNPPSQTFTNLQGDEVASFFIAEVGTFTRYFAEGATSGFFDTEIALLNATGQPATATVRFQRPVPAPEVTETVSLSGLQRVTVNPKLLGLTVAEFSTVIESTQPIIADRTMTWDARGYGSHAETSIGRPLTEWFLAEGATISGFDLFYLIQNPNDTAVQVEVRYLLPAPLAPEVKTYTVGPKSRFTIWVNKESATLAAAEVSAAITASLPVIVERAMYRPVGAQIFGAGQESAGVEAPSLQWFFAEGATGNFFDLFYLVANPGAQASEVEAKYLKPDGSVVTRTYTIPPNSRFNIWVDFEGPELADTAVATTFRVTNGVPVVIERAMWWSGGVASWYEGHNTAGATVTGEKWGLAAGEVGGPTGIETYILIANTSAFAGTARVTLTFEDGTQATKDFGLGANSRLNVPVSFEFPAANGKRFGAVVESLGASPAQIVVERAMYNNAEGVLWAAGTSALGTRLR
jgi:hypothetical protein